MKKASQPRPTRPPGTDRPIRRSNLATTAGRQRLDDAKATSLNESPKVLDAIKSQMAFFVREAGGAVSKVCRLHMGPWPALNIKLRESLVQVLREKPILYFGLSFMISP